MINQTGNDAGLLAAAWTAAKRSPPAGIFRRGQASDAASELIKKTI
jgi:hypothetical protein